MTKKQMEELAELIFQKLLNRQSEFDKQFIQQMKESGQEFTVEINDYRPDTELSDNKESVNKAFVKEGLIQEMTALQRLLEENLAAERYEDCVEIKGLIREIEDKLKKL